MRSGYHGGQSMTGTCACGCEALIIKVMAPFESFARFSEGDCGRHNEQYYP